MHSIKLVKTSSLFSVENEVNSALLAIYKDKDKNKHVKINELQFINNYYIVVLEIFEKEKIGF